MQLLLLFLSACFFICHSAQNFDRVLNSIPKTSFSCEGKGNGYFADIEARCQSYHLCDDGGRQYTYLCPNQTLFNQRMLICDHWYQVECSLSAEFYNKNELIGNLDLHFLSDEEGNHPKKKVGEGSFPDHLAASSIVASQVRGGFKTGPAKSGIREEVEATEDVKTGPRTSTTESKSTTTETRTQSFEQTTTKPTTQRTTQRRTVPSTIPVTETTFAAETTTASLPLELHTNGEQLTTIVQEERITLTKLLSPVKTQKKQEKELIVNTFESEESESEEDSSESPKSLFDTEPNSQPVPGTLEYEIVSIANAHANEQLTTLGFTAEDTAAHEHSPAHKSGSDAHSHAHDLFLPLFDMRRMFFIPADDHPMPPEKEVFNVKLNTIDEGLSMKFNEKKFFRKSGRTLDPNPQCPHCHPHFLQPGQCIPCVIIR